MAVIRVHAPGLGQLAMIIHALNTLGLFFGLGQRGQQHGRQYRNDRDDHQQLDERECPPLLFTAWNTVFHNRYRLNYALFFLLRSSIIFGLAEFMEVDGEGREAQDYEPQRAFAGLLQARKEIIFGLMHPMPRAW